MTEVPVYEAETRLSELLARVQQGEAVTITRHGRPMARLVAAVISSRELDRSDLENPAGGCCPQDR